MGLAEDGRQRKARKGRRNHDKDLAMYAFTFLTITSFPVTHGKDSTLAGHHDFRIYMMRYIILAGSVYDLIETIMLKLTRKIL